MRSHACRLRRLWRVTSGGGPADTVGLASGQRVATVLISLFETTGRLVWRARD
jgi:hypothetical protein